MCSHLLDNIYFSLKKTYYSSENTGKKLENAELNVDIN